MEKYINKGSGVALENTNHVSELKNIIIKDDNVFFVVSTSSGDDRVLLFNDTSFGILNDSSRDELSISDINPELAKNFMNDIATLIIRDLGNIKDINESIKIFLEEEGEEIKLLFRDETRDEKGIKLLFMDEKLDFIFVILLGDKNISIFNPENGKEIITSEYNLDMARIVMTNIFLSSFRPDVPHAFYNHIEIQEEEEDYIDVEAQENYKIVDLATPILSNVNYNLIMDDFITYFYQLECFVNRDNIKNLIEPFVRSGWTGAVKFILDKTDDDILRINGNNIMFTGDDNIVYMIILNMIQSNDQEMFDFVFDEFMPKYGYNNEINYIDLAFMIINFGTVEQFIYLSNKLPIGVDLARQEDSLYRNTLLFRAIVKGKTDIVEYMISNYDIDPNEGVEYHQNNKLSYICLSLVHNEIEIFKLLISKDGLVLSEEDRELIERKAKSNEGIRTAYEEYLERNGVENAINNFDPDKGHFTSI